jgi:hypothetical protein
LGQGNTDDDGQAAISTTVRPLTAEGVRARLSLPELQKDFEKNISASSVIFTWTPLASDKSFSFLVDSKNPKITETIKGKLTSSVTRCGYKINPNSELVLNASVIPSPGGNTEGITGSMVNLSVDLNIFFIEKKTNTVRGNVKFTSKGIGKTEEEAIGKGLSKLIIDEKKLGELLEK